MHCGPLVARHATGDYWDAIGRLTSATADCLTNEPVQMYYRDMVTEPLGNMIPTRLYPSCFEVRLAWGSC